MTHFTANNNAMMSFSEFLIENSSATIRALVDEFSDLVVFCRSEPFDISIDRNGERIFAVLNKMLFKGRLDDVPMFYGTISELNQTRRQQNEGFEMLQQREGFFWSVLINV